MDSFCSFHFTPLNVYLILAANLIFLRLGSYPIIFLLKSLLNGSLCELNKGHTENASNKWCILVCLILGQLGPDNQYNFLIFEFRFCILAKILESEVLTFSVHHIRRLLMLICSITKNGNWSFGERNKWWVSPLKSYCISLYITRDLMGK